MAPEEFQRGATIDDRTMVFILGRTAFVFLSEDLRGDQRRELWTAGDELYEVAARATTPKPEDRWPTVEGFVQAWRDAASRVG